MANLCQSTDQHADILCDDQSAGKKLCESAEDTCDEMWVEILSRLPIKSLVVCQSVHSSWRNIVGELKKKIWSNPQSVPVCGLLLLFSPTIVNQPITAYTCIKTGKQFRFPLNSADKRLIARSGYERGLLADLDFEFSSFGNWILEQRYFVTMHQGLILISFFDGLLYRVCNPVTKESYDVPGERMIPNSDVMLTVGMIITFPTLPGCKCEFMIVKLSPSWKSINIYCSETRCWQRCELEIGKNHQLRNEPPVRNLGLVKYVALVDGSDSSLFLWTGKHAVAIKFSGSKIADEYVIPRPRNMKHPEQYDWRKSRVWGCGGNLYLTCNVIELGIWKHPKEYDWRAADACAWVPLVKISMRICQQVKAAGGGSLVALSPIACNPEIDVIYLMSEEDYVFAYDLRSDMLHKIAEGHTLPGDYFPFKPCLSSLYAFN